MEDLTNEIDRYLSGEMTIEEKSSFEEKISNDPTLKEEINLQKKTVRLIEQAAYLKTKEQVVALNANSTKVFSLKPVLRVAAVLAILLVSSYFLLVRNYKDEALYQAYYSPNPDHLTAMGENDETLSAAMNLYNQKEYERAEKLFKKIVANDSDYSEQVLLYRATCLTELDQPEKAIQLIEKSKKGLKTYSPSKEWQLILSHLANGGGEESIVLLKKFLKKNDGYQNTRATELLKDLESIWR